MSHSTTSALYFSNNIKCCNIKCCNLAPQRIIDIIFTAIHSCDTDSHHLKLLNDCCFSVLLLHLVIVIIHKEITTW